MEDNEKNDEFENNLVKVIKEIEYDENKDASTINNQENSNSSFNNSIINKYNELKDKIPDIIINNENELLYQEIIEIYKYYQSYLNFKDNNYNICKKCGKNNFFL